MTNSPINTLSKNPKELTISRQLQEKWRQKQLDIFYKNGRPIFGTFVNNKYVPYNQVRMVF